MPHFTREAIALSKEEIDFRRMLDDEMETPEEQVYVTQFIRKPNKDGFQGAEEGAGLFGRPFGASEQGRFRL
jgi:hypothetical protein